MYQLHVVLIKYNKYMYTCSHMIYQITLTYLGTYSLNNLTNSLSRPTSSIHFISDSQVQGTEGSSTSSSSLLNHCLNTARTNSLSSLPCLFLNSLTVSGFWSSISAKSLHWVDWCEVIHLMIFSHLPEPSFRSMAMSSFMVGLGATVTHTQVNGATVNIFY